MLRCFFLLLTLTTMILTSCGDEGRSPHHKDDPTKDPVVSKDAKPGETPKPASDAKQKKVTEPAAEPALIAFSSYCADVWKRPDEKVTVEALVKVLARKDCLDLEKTFTTVTSLQIDGQGIRSLEPLVYFRNLRMLTATKNDVEDISALKRMSALEVVDLSDNKVKDITAIASIPSLKSVVLVGNPISDLAPLGASQSLRSFYFLRADQADVLRADANAGETSTTASCEDGFLINPYKSCEHPTFGVATYRASRGEVCGLDESRTRYRACRHVDHGFEDGGAWSKEFNVVASEGKTWVRPEAEVQRYANDYCKTILATDLPEQLNKTYGTSAQWRQTRAQGEIESRMVNVGTAKQPSWITRSVVNCRLYYQVRHGKLGESPSCGVVVPVYKTCRHSSFGVERYRSGVSAACGYTDIMTLKPVNDRDYLQKTSGKVLTCSSCRDIEAKDTAGVQARLDCYAHNLQVGSPDEVRSKTRAALPTFFAAKASLFTAQQLQQYARLSGQ